MCIGTKPPREAYDYVLQNDSNKKSTALQKVADKGHRHLVTEENSLNIEGKLPFPKQTHYICVTKYTHRRIRLIYYLKSDNNMSKRTLAHVEFPPS